MALLAVVFLETAASAQAQTTSDQDESEQENTPLVDLEVSEVEPQPIAIPVAPVDSSTVARQASFDVGLPLAMAAFTRGEALWLVFAAESPLDSAHLARQGELGLGAARIAEARGGVALRFDNPGRQTPMVRRNGTEWIVDLPLSELDTRPPLEVIAQPEHPDGARLFIEATGAVAPVAFIDPLVGDILVAMPLGDVGQRLTTAQRFAEFGLLPSVLGVVVRTFIEDIRVLPTEGGVAISSERGLQLS
ncbi:MAG: hypothetical protein AAF414_20720 [Pseudomonadota bacterium]